MSSTNKTAHLNMHSWVRTDPVVCEDFNDNFNKLDSAIGNLRASRGNCEIYSGTYVGNGTKSFSLTFPKRPVYLVIQRDTSNTLSYTGFVVKGGRFYGHYNGDYYNKMYVNGTTVTLQENGEGNNMVLNISGTTFRYLAFAPAE